jgi:hypothetical protein
VHIADLPLTYPSGCYFACLQTLSVVLGPQSRNLFECSFILLSWRKIPEDAVSHQALPQELAELTLNSAMQKLTKGLG